METTRPLISYEDREDYGYIRFWLYGRFIGHAAQLFDDEETPGPFEAYAPHPTLYNNATHTGTFIPLGTFPTLIAAMQGLVEWSHLIYRPAMSDE